MNDEEGYYYGKAFGNTDKYNLYYREDINF